MGSEVGEGSEGCGAHGEDPAVERRLGQAQKLIKTWGTASSDSCISRVEWKEFQGILLLRVLLERGEKERSNRWVAHKT